MRSIRFVVITSILLATDLSHASEVCGNTEDDDSDGVMDEGCASALVTSQCESPLSCADTGVVVRRREHCITRYRPTCHHLHLGGLRSERADFTPACTRQAPPRQPGRGQWVHAGSILTRLGSRRNLPTTYSAFRHEWCCTRCVVKTFSQHKRRAPAAGRRFNHSRVFTPSICASERRRLKSTSSRC